MQSETKSQFIKKKIQPQIDQINEYKSILRDNKSYQVLFKFLQNRRTANKTTQKLVGFDQKTTALASIRIKDIGLDGVNSINQADLQQTLKDRFELVEKERNKVEKLVSLHNLKQKIEAERETRKVEKSKTLDKFDPSAEYSQYYKTRNEIYTGLKQFIGRPSPKTKNFISNKIQENQRSKESSLEKESRYTRENFGILTRPTLSSGRSNPRETRVIVRKTGKVVRRADNRT